ncbi:putative small ubiquitin-related modifier 8 [Coffea eugenioides]|uniref:putative small ubiquitin-related modifier 8 n=1 Tax=Coffea eugenioides TaxID=49369 RepID=UPI000F60C1C2|nr:putative small ubiquitin-related modifier 8 [Coffea eugenioides]
MSANGGESTASIEMEKSKVTESTVAIKVTSQDGKETFFRIRRESQMKKLLIAYCQKFFLNYQATRFFYEGDYFNHNKTPNELGMEDDALIECLVEQLGGGGMSSSSKMAD